MAKQILSEAQWRRVAPCIPAPPHRRRVPGPQPISDRSVLVGILFVLKTGLPWEELPAEVGAGSGMTCLRRLRQWQRVGVWRRIRRTLSGLMDPGEIDWGRADSRAKSVRRPAPTDLGLRRATNDRRGRRMRKGDGGGSAPGSDRIRGVS